MLHNFFVYMAKGVALMGMKGYMPDSSALMKLIHTCFVTFASVKIAAIL